MKILKFLAISAVVLSISGCAPLQIALGISTSALEKAKERHSKVFDKDMAYCHDKTIDALNKWKAKVYLDNKKGSIIAMEFQNVFNSCIDTTEAGIFFKELDPNKTQVDVASLNYQLGKFVADNLFKFLENPEAPTCPLLTEREKSSFLKK